MPILKDLLFIGFYLVFIFFDKTMLLMKLGEAWNLLPCCAGSGPQCLWPAASHIRQTVRLSTEVLA